MRRILKMFGGRSSGADRQGPTVENELRPDAPFYAVGDIHGRVDLLLALLPQIMTDEDQTIVFLGDYVDRGPASAAVLTALYDLAQSRPAQIVCLMGNHEKMMLQFIDDPLDRGARWLRNGGRETLASFGIDLPKTPTPDQALAACEALEDALPSPLVAWLRDLPLSWNSGNVWCAHAAMNPERAPDMQKPETLLWGHRLFLGQARQDGHCVIHGHTIVHEPLNHDSRIAIDTGAYKTGRLTAAHIALGACRFIST
ncbi:serine/threonine protein phosphatase [Yoonia sp. F2084L]|uniref:metallophosphoesterase family protein n=1 Tax=Yoonia sp. F2084L TaxID=2926419 RepID=UPI001FF3172A|nr:metallophosphoesterase family protein [Yoonia sp. F2084L]MCK0097151.1 serine/threonine protein phosphatase [Yoonia sp. F2084L]